MTADNAQIRLRSGMSSEIEQRKLAAIMFTDMVGYTALAQRDEKVALQLLEEHRQLLRKIFPRFNGAEIKTIGDAFLVEFNSALEAAQCAIEIQRALAKRNADSPSDRRIELKIGIHIGDVVHRSGDVYGDGVNIASRIEPLAGAGGICVSMDVERQIRNALEARFEKLAAPELKNISVAMDLFRIVLPWEVPAAAGKSEIGNQRPSGSDKSAITRKQRRFPISALAGVGIFVVIAIALALGWWWSTLPHKKMVSSAPEINRPQDIPEKSVAVLPFENLSRDPDNAFFTDGVQDQVLTALAKVADLKVISRTSVMQYKTGQSRNLREIAQQLGVTHVLEGSVQRAGNKVRVNAQLINARTDAHEWADNYDRPVDDVFAIQSEIAKAIADQLQAKLSPKERSAIEQPPTADVTAFDLYSRAKSLMLSTSFSALASKNVEQAISLLEQAISRDPSFFLAYCQLSLAHDQQYFLTGADHTPARIGKAQSALDAALRLRPDAGEAHLARAEFLYRIHLDYDGALAELEIARHTLPNDPRIFELTGYILRRRGKQEEGLDYINRALTLDPRNLFTLQQVALSYLYLRRFQENVAVLDRALAIKPDDPDTMVARGITVLGWKGDTRPLHQTIDEVRAKNPAAVPGIADSWLLCALAEHDARAGEAALAALGDNTFGDDASQFGPDFGRGLLARMTKDENKAQAAFTAARTVQEKRVQEQPDYAPALSILGIIDAALGRKEDALREGRRAVELLPVEKEANNGPGMIQNLAIIAAWAGEKEFACDQLEASLKLPGLTCYGRLKLLPWWDPLRGDPRFEKIVQSLAPK
jgi:TolB-like protein/class 3 adenylate cyclase/Tfp pilus assembly protein PilF